MGAPLAMPTAGLADADPLTGLLHRQAFLTELERRLSGGVSLSELTAVVIVKVRHLADINRELGFAAADEVLRLSAERLCACLRPGDIVARLGSGSFALLLPGLSTAAQPLLAIAKIQQAFEASIGPAEHDLRVRLSFGVSICPLDTMDAEQLVRCAGEALAHAIARRLPSALYSDCDPARTALMLGMERELEEAIRTSALRAVFQPVIDIDAERFVSVELLARWHSPRFGNVSPDVFIQLAERCHLIGGLTAWSLNNGLREARETAALASRVSVAVNLSPGVILDPNFTHMLHGAMELWEMPPERLCLEITETAMVEEPDKCLAVLSQLREEGMSIAIDDFGTGYSSLEYLKRFPATLLKIDKSFVINMRNDKSDRRIVQSVIDLAHNLDIAVVAEGVEDEETLDALTLMGCERAQGYFIARPMPATDLDAWLADSPWLVAGD